MEEMKRCEKCGHLLYTRLDVDPEREVLSTVEMVSNFLESSLFKDYLDEIDIRLAPLYDVLEDRQLAHTGRHYDWVRGGLETFKHMRNIFNELLDIKKREEE